MLTAACESWRMTFSWHPPHYGERWARHWLDVVRFAEESDGFEKNTPARMRGPTATMSDPRTE